MNQIEQIPVTIITGFLGAGKTTLLNNIIKKHPEKRFAIIENEFGETGIDNDLVIGAEEGIFEMSNGCLCCTLSDELFDTLNTLLKRRSQFDHLLIETTGIAEPSSVAAPFLADEQIKKYFKLDGTICLADTQYLEDNLKEDDNAVKQVTFADLILMNKQDLVNTSYAKDVKTTIKGINPYADILLTENAEFGEKNILGLRAYDGDKVEEKTSFIHHHHHHHHNHITSHSITAKGTISPEQLDHWLSVLLQLQGEAFYRIKGIFHFPNEPRKVIFQSVRSNATLSLGSEWLSHEEKLNRIVFIGKELNKNILERRFKHCLLK